MLVSLSSTELISVRLRLGYSCPRINVLFELVSDMLVELVSDMLVELVSDMLVELVSDRIEKLSSVLLSPLDS